ncbi:hypothetical protein S7711_11426 [Stachybotrys chartarum IBT 7711]|uniref:Histidine-specific methyltransferase SAM-dependent domain-containing protein n=1 Tax=Stachybotrys chartarum (strain CBS 109288 / IBT 7711) TaxID=1280523 RepID=A0A084B813_STACB|nr:hypothetical protein S7711_11426 [Stachybotrys chartarum IBT 7711]
MPPEFSTSVILLLSTLLLPTCAFIGAQDTCEFVLLFDHAYCPLPSRLLASDHPVIDLARDCDRLKEEMNNTYHKGGQIPKEHFYYHGNWDSVALESPQTHGELGLLYQYMPQIVGKLESSSIIFELGPSTYLAKSRAILDALQATGSHHWYVLVEYNQDIFFKMDELQQDYSLITFIIIRGAFDQVFPLAKELTHGRTAALLSFGSTFTNADKNVLHHRFQTWGSIASVVILGQDMPLEQQANQWHDNYHSRPMQNFIRDAFERADAMLGKTRFSDSIQLPCNYTSTSHTYKFQLNNDKEVEVFTSIKSNEATILDPLVHEPLVFRETLGADNTTMRTICPILEHVWPYHSTELSRAGHW